MEYTPKGGMCANCKHVDRDCSNLSFSTMQVIEQTSELAIVRCTNFKPKEPTTKPKIKLKSRVSHYTVTHTQYLSDKEITKLFTAQRVEVVDFDCEPDATKYYWTVHVEEE